MRVTFSFMRGNVKTITVTRSIVELINSMAMPYLPLYVLLLGGTEPMVGLIYALGSLANLILSPVGGYVADYRGRVKLIIFLIFSSSFGYLFFVFAQSWITVAFGMFFIFLFGFWVSLENALVADSLHPKDRAVGFATIMAIPYGMAVISPYVGGYLVEIWKEYAIRILFSIAFILGLVRALISLKFLKETVAGSEEMISFHNFPLMLKTSYEKVWEALKWMPKSLRSIVTISFINEIFTRMVRPFTVVYAVTVIKLSPSQYGAILLIASATRTLLMMPLGMFVGKYGGRRRILLATLAVAPIPVFFFIYSKTFLLTLILFLFTVIIDAISWPAFSALTADIVPKERRGRINAALGESGVFIDIVGRPRAGGFLISMAALIGSATGGYIYGFNPTYIWLIFSLALIVCCLLFAIYVREPEKYEE